ncbi:phosphoribosyltransferase [Vreelandella venusta]|uniref:phosphoribosyltransferase family protein n=1 Tax=Vreelandella venusta TaxID=44935 RepID=UPI00384F22DF
MKITFKSYGDLGRDITKNFIKFSGDWDLVVGIPRSGMVPAYMIALALNVDCTDISSWLKNYPLKRGITRSTRKKLKFPWEAKKVLIVDDSIMSGNSLKSEIEALPTWLSSRASTLAVYSSKPFRKDVDIFLEFVPHPRAFEWNIFHHKVISRSCISLEGMLKKGVADKNMTAEFRFIPSGIINTIVAFQNKEKRKEVESILEESGIKYRDLVMPNNEVNGASLDDIIKFKVESFTASDAEMFIENDSYQAKVLCREVKKPVFCLSDSYMYNPDDEFTARFFKNKMKFIIWKLINSKDRKQGFFF